MFDKIGGTIKGLAKFVCWVGIIVSIILGIVLMVVGSKNHNDSTTIIGVVILIGGALLSWVGSFFIYGFGELIDRTTSIDEKLSNNNNQTKKVEQSSNDSKKGNTDKIAKLNELHKEGLISDDEYLHLSKDNSLKE